MNLFKDILPKKKTFILNRSTLLLLLVMSTNGLAQSGTNTGDNVRETVIIKPDSTLKINDIFLSFGSINYSAEYYTIDSKNSFLEHHLTYQPYVMENQNITLELGLADAYLETGHYFTPTDLNITYQRIFEPKDMRESGYQGVGFALKFTLPTGRDKYFSGFDSWTIEPSVGMQWFLTNVNWLFSTSARYNYSYAALPGSSPRFSYLRLEAHFGYENIKWWVFIEPDYRFIPTNKKSTVLIGINAGYKLSKSFSLGAVAKPRIMGSNFYESLYSVGGTWFF